MYTDNAKFYRIINAADNKFIFNLPGFEAVVYPNPEMLLHSSVDHWHETGFIPLVGSIGKLAFYPTGKDLTDYYIADGDKIVVLELTHQNKPFFITIALSALELVQAD